MASDFEDLNFENLVRFYRKELMKIEKGDRATDVFSLRIKKRLRKKGILVYKVRKWVVSEEAKKYLSKL